MINLRINFAVETKVYGSIQKKKSSDYKWGRRWDPIMNKHITLKIIVTHHMIPRILDQQFVEWCVFPLYFWKTYLIVTKGVWGAKALMF